MKLRKYIQKRGAGAKLAADIGAPHSSISDWASGKRPVPVCHCAAIEAATNGSVTRRELRNNDWWKIWPELVTAEFPRPAARQIHLISSANKKQSAKAASCVGHS